MPGQKKVKKIYWYLLLAAIMFSLCLKVYGFYWPKATAQIGGQTIKVLVAENNRHYHKGLGNRKNLGKYGGMLFVFAQDGQYTMVMRNMQFAIDIVWLDNYKIVDIAPSAQPQPGINERLLTQYIPRLPADMVLELPAGFSKENGVKIGDIVKIQR